MKSRLSYILFTLLVTTTFFACYKANNCDDEALTIATNPLENLGFRIIDTAGRDLLASQTPGKLSFDSLSARQPCNKVDSLGKRLVQIGAGGLESYAFFLANLYQPIPDEAAECYTIQLNWGGDNTDVIKMDTYAEHNDCGVSYSINTIWFNGFEVKPDASGYYVLQRR